MRVLLSPGAEGLTDGPGLAARLAGSAPVVSLRAAGIATLRRALSPAEVHAVRKALLGLGSGEALRARPEGESLVGFVCAGRKVRVGGPGSEEVFGAVVAISDHVNLTWSSPLRGPNDDVLGPRFPVMAGLYRAEVVLDVWGEAVASVVGCVGDAEKLGGLESWAIVDQEIGWVSDELAQVAIVAAHLGYRVAAALLVDGETLVPAPGLDGKER